jgi:hypothetical protein
MEQEQMEQPMTSGKQLLQIGISQNKLWPSMAKVLKRRRKFNKTTP